MSQSTGHHPKSNSRKHVGIVALAGKQSPSIWESDWVERTAAGKDCTPLQHRHKLLVGHVGYLRTESSEGGFGVSRAELLVSPGAVLVVPPRGQDRVLFTLY